MRTNQEDPKSAKRSSFGKDEAQKKSMTSVGDKAHKAMKDIAKRMVHKFPKNGGMSYIGMKKK